MSTGASRRTPAGGAAVGEFVRLDVDGGNGTIRLDRPPMNALNIAVQEELRAAAREVTARGDIRAVVIYGGPRVFVRRGGRQGDCRPGLRRAGE